MTLPGENEFAFRKPPFEAHYYPSPVPTHEGNPLIRTLPPTLPREEVARRLTYRPPFAPDDREKPTEVRRSLMVDAARFFQPLEVHLRLYDNMTDIMRNGYVSRNPLKVGYWPETEQKIRSVLEFSPDEEEASQVAAQGLTILALTGLGKTRGTMQVLSRIPQHILHHAFEGQPCRLRQLVWLRVICPHDGTLAGVCHEFFRAVDRVIGSRYHDYWALRGRPTVDHMVAGMTRVAALHHLGVLVIDELQNLNVAHSGGATKILQFFHALDTGLGVPVVLIGTPAAGRLLTTDLLRARRAIGVGNTPWRRMSAGREWDLFFETLMHYQYVRHPLPIPPPAAAGDGTTPSTPEAALQYERVKERLLEESLGITDLVVKLFFLAQMHAMLRSRQHDQREEVTPALLSLVAERHLLFVRPFLKAIRADDLPTLERLGDMPKIDLQDALAELLQPASVQSSQTSQPSARSQGAPVPRRNPAAEQVSSPDGAVQATQLTGPCTQANTARSRRTKAAHGSEQGLLGVLTTGRTAVSPYDAAKAAGYVRGPLDLPGGSSAAASIAVGSPNDEGAA